MKGVRVRVRVLCGLSDDGISSHRPQQQLAFVTLGCISCIICDKGHCRSPFSPCDYHRHTLESSTSDVSRFPKPETDMRLSKQAHGVPACHPPLLGTGAFDHYQRSLWQPAQQEPGAPVLSGRTGTYFGQADCILSCWSATESRHEKGKGKGRRRVGRRNGTELYLLGQAS